MSIWKVYLITNKTNGKGYVGITSKPIEVRLSNHVVDAFPGRRNPNGTLYALHAALQKYGADNFTILELEMGLTLESARFREKHYIAKLGTYGGGRGKRGYNQTLGGEMPDEAYGYHQPGSKTSKMPPSILAQKPIDQTPLEPSAQKHRFNYSSIIVVILLVLAIIYLAM